MDLKAKPILVVPAVPLTDGMRFLHPSEQMDLGAEQADTVWRILAHCDGYHTVPEVADLAQLEENTVQAVLSELHELWLVQDAREQYRHFHALTCYPAPLTRELDESTLREHLAGFEAAHPLQIWVVTTGNRLGLPSGYYQYHAGHDTLVLKRGEIDTEQLGYCFNQPGSLVQALQIVVTAVFTAGTPGNCTNRNYRRTLIEAGQLAGSISAYCEGCSLQVRELYNFQDLPLKEELGLDDEEYPLVVLEVDGDDAVLGRALKTTSAAMTALGDAEAAEDWQDHYLQTQVGADQPVQQIAVKTFAEDGAMFGAAAVYKDACGRTQYAGATGTSCAEATLKAAVEGYERWRSGQVRTDFFGSARQLEKDRLAAWLHPYSIVPMTVGRAIASFAQGLKEFTVDLPIRWTRGTDHNGEAVYVPADLVYYDHPQVQICHNNSSGVAAYTSFDVARRRATVELIERDAIMRNWYAREAPLRITHLAIHTMQRQSHWADQGRRLEILQLPSDWGYVALAVITSNGYPCFVSGAAATLSTDSIDVAVNKAVQEAEYNLLLALESPCKVELTPKMVRTPLDHGRFYHTPEHARQLDWLLEGPAAAEFRPMLRRPFDELAAELDLVTVELTDEAAVAANGGLHVVRVLSRHLVPIGFGPWVSSGAHPTLREIVQESTEWPHYFA